MKKTLNRHYEPNPLENLHAVNEKTDVRRKQRAPDPAEVRKLYRATRKAGTVFGLKPMDRVMLYRTALTVRAACERIAQPDARKLHVISNVEFRASGRKLFEAPPRG